MAARVFLALVVASVSVGGESVPPVCPPAGWDKTGVPREHQDEGVLIGLIHSIRFIRKSGSRIFLFVEIFCFSWVVSVLGIPT